MKVIALLLCLGCSQNNEPPRVERRIEPVEAAKPVEAPKAGVSQRLFADDIAVNTLPLSIAIETIGGVSSILIPRGTKLPVSHTEVFSTALDDQTQVEVHVLQGERPLAADNRSLGKFQLFGIPLARRGVPQIEVTFTMDAQAVLHVTARDKATNATKAIVIEGAVGALDKAALAKILEQTALASKDDAQRRTWSETRLKLNDLVYEGKHLLASVGDKVSPATQKRWTDELARAETLLAATTTPGDPKLLVRANEELQKVMRTVSEELYIAK